MVRQKARRILAENIRIIRLLRNLSQEGLAELVDLDRSYLGGIERAERNVSLDTLEKIAEGLGMAIPDLLCEPNPCELADRILEMIHQSVDGLSPRIREEGMIYCRWPVAPLETH